MSCAFCLYLFSPRDFVKPMSLVVDNHGSGSSAASPGLRYVQYLSFGLAAVITASAYFLCQWRQQVKVLGCCL